MIYYVKFFTFGEIGERIPSMSEYFPMRGICLGCQSGTVCDVHQSRAILECGTFEALDGREQRNFAVNLWPYYVQAQTFRGLCGDCEIRARCENAYHTGGIWSCDQYR